eukprot:s1677_g12.t1
MKPLNKKRRLTEDERNNLRRCLSVSGASEEHTRKIWNIAGELRESAQEASKRQLYNVVEERLHFARACFLDKKVQTEAGPDADLIVLNVARALQTIVQRCPAWGDALLEAHAAAGGWLTLVTYHDEIVCGNVLAVVKRKKFSAFYISFKEMRRHFRLEQAWLPAMTLPREFVESLAGGLSGAVKVFIKVVYETSSEITLTINGTQVRFKLRPHSHLLSDHDAQRATFLSKGSAALKPCLYCANICKKDTVPESSENFHGIESAKWEQFVPVKPSHWTYAVNHLTACHRQKDIEKWEKAYGLNKHESGIMFDVEARTLMNPTDALNDALHCYYCNGVASVEISLLVETATACGVDRESLQAEALSVQWHKPGLTLNSSQSLIKRLFKEKMFEGPVYKGDGKDTKPLVYLLAYYVTLLREEQPEMRVACESFLALKHCCYEMHQLYIRSARITARDEVQAFHDAQILHQELFVQAHGGAAVRPKHHHRLHLPNHALLLGDLPECSVAALGASRCEPCKAGTSPNADRSECMRCADGQVAPPRSAQCTPCELGWVPDASRTGCLKCTGQHYALDGYEECRSCTFPAMILGRENWCTSLYFFLFLLAFLLLALFVAAIFGKCRLECFKRRLRTLGALETQKAEVKTRSFQLGISLHYVFEELQAMYREKALEAEWRLDTFGPATRSSYFVKLRNMGENVPDREAAWNALPLCPAPEDPNFHQVAGLLAYGPLALGKGQYCPRDGRMDCSIVDALEASQRSGRATWFLSWVWGYKFSTVFGALSRWWKRHQIVSGDTCADVYIWWCVMVNNQFRMLEEGQTAELWLGRPLLFYCLQRALALRCGSNISPSRMSIRTFEGSCPLPVLYEVQQITADCGPRTAGKKIPQSFAKTGNNSETPYLVVQIDRLEIGMFQEFGQIQTSIKTLGISLRSGLPLLLVSTRHNQKNTHVFTASS